MAGVQQWDATGSSHHDPGSDQLLTNPPEQEQHGAGYGYCTQHRHSS